MDNKWTIPNFNQGEDRKEPIIASTELIDGAVHGFINGSLVFITALEVWEKIQGREYLVEVEEAADGE